MDQWIINKDVINGGEYDGMASGDNVDESKCDHIFRMKDDDGEVYFYGVTNNSSSFDPLDDFGSAFGCTSIEYKENGKWEVL